MCPSRLSWSYSGKPFPNPPVSINRLLQASTDPVHTRTIFTMPHQVLAPLFPWTLAVQMNFLQRWKLSTWALSITRVTSHRWLLSTWKMASSTKNWAFILVLIIVSLDLNNHLWLVEMVLDRLSTPRTKTTLNLSWCPWHPSEDPAQSRSQCLSKEQVNA